MNKELQKKYSGPIAWMTQNHVAANLLMLIIIIGGFISLSNIKQEIFPEFELDFVTISCPYPGASPSEVESGVLLTLEEKIRSVDGIKTVNSVAKEGIGVVSLELLTGANRNKVLNDVKNVVDRITSFPEDMEKPSVSLIDRKISVVSLIIYGDEDHATLHSLSEVVRADLLREPEISQVEIGGVKPLEISIEISRENLEAYGLTLAQVAAQVKMFSVELPGGSVETKGGTFLVRVSDRKLRGEQFENVIIKATGSGAEVRLGDIATINDGYQDVDLEYRFNGKPAVTLTAYRIGKETPNDVAEAVHKYLEKNRNRFPDSIQLSIWDDNSILLKQRIQLLVKNAITGLILVIIVLAMFLQKRLAMWVALGIPVSFLGTFFFMGPLGASINMITLFALIITLGMVVDDAIIIAENVYHKMNKGMSPLQAAIEGAQEMTVPVTFSILTTIAAFFPLFVIPGVMGKIFYLIPVVVILVLTFSWLESFFILPAHLGHGIHNKENWISKKLAWIDRIQEKCNSWLKEKIEKSYQPFLRKVLKHRYLAVSISIATLFLVIGTLPAGILKFYFFPPTEREIVSASIRLNYGVPLKRTEEVADILLEGCNKTIAQLKAEDNIRGIFTRIGETGTTMGPGAEITSGSHLLSFLIDLGPSDERDFSVRDFATVWKKNLPPIAGTESFKVGGGGGPSAGKDVDLELYHSDIKILGEASYWLTEKLRGYSVLTDVENSFTGGKQQLDFKLRPGAYTLGITSRDVGTTIRSSFYGAEALREQRERNEMKVVVRLPEAQRTSEYDIEQLMIPTSKRTYVPLSSVAEMTRGTAPTEINRIDGERVVNVSAEMVPGTISGNEMVASLKGQQIKGPVTKRLEEKGRIEKRQGLLEEMEEKFPGIRWSLAGQQKAQRESFASLGTNYLLALIVIFTLLAIPFRSYFQPLIVMTAIPFGIVGAFAGHLLLGYDLSIISAMGIIALSGVVVNDSLVLVDATNKYRLQGLTVTESLVRAGMRRFRPIMLTSLTTFFGLLPMIFETSLQARFLIPMAISLGFGILFATVIVLLIVPALYIWLERIRFRLGYIEESEI